MTNAYEDYYLLQVGGNAIPVFHGSLNQRGFGLGGILSGLARSIVPLFKKVAKVIGKQAIRTGTEILNDTLHGRNLKQSAKRRMTQAGKRLAS